MSRVKTVADEEEISVDETESSSASEIENQQAEESGTSDNTEDSASKAETENVSSEPDVNENIAAEKKYGIVRYFQMNPLENKTLERTLKKMYGRESHSLSGWKNVIEKFLNQKV